jgi:hypothetical protein
MGQKGHVARVGNAINTSRVLVGKCNPKDHLVYLGQNEVMLQLI